MRMYVDLNRNGRHLDTQARYADDRQPEPVRIIILKDRVPRQMGCHRVVESTARTLNLQNRVPSPSRSPTEEKKIKKAKRAQSGDLASNICPMNSSYDT